MKITLTKLRCLRCGNEWFPNPKTKGLPKTCANRECRSPYWNRPRRKAAKQK